MKVISMKKANITFEDVKLFLNYPNEFWEYVTPKIKRVDSKIPGNEIFYATLLKFNDNNQIKDIIVMVPYIIDMKTACINVHELKHAYDMYLKINEYIDDSDPKYEEDAIELEKQFQKKLTNYHK